jgi:hypothetical protein
LKDGGRRDRRKLKIGKSLSCILLERPLSKTRKLLETLRRGVNERRGIMLQFLSTFLRFLRSSALKVFLLFPGCFRAEC